MATSNLPPQAYTKDILAQAYDWLKYQPPSVRELASSADNLVALYLQAHRRATHKSTHGFENAPSSEAFRSDLKNLAQDLKKFDQQKKATKQPDSDNNMSKDVPVTNHQVPTSPGAHSASQSEPASPSTASASSSPAYVVQPRFTDGLDRRTKEILQDVQYRLNLSSEQEAMRMLIAIGFERIRDILPKF